MYTAVSARARAEAIPRCYQELARSLGQAARSTLVARLQGAAAGAAGLAAPRGMTSEAGMCCTSQLSVPDNFKYVLHFAVECPYELVDTCHWRRQEPAQLARWYCRRGVRCCCCWKVFRQLESSTATGSICSSPANHFRSLDRCVHAGLRHPASGMALHSRCDIDSK